MAGAMGTLLPPLLPLLGATSTVDVVTFVVSAVMVLVGAGGVVFARNTVHAALMLVMTLFGIAVLFVEQQANFLAAVQVIVYAGAIVVLFLFVIMFLGVDKQEDIEREPLPLQRPLAYVLVALALAFMVVLGVTTHWAVGAHSVAGVAHDPHHAESDVVVLGRAVFTTYLFPFEITSALLLIAVVGAVVLARRPAQVTAAEREPEEPAEEGADVGYGTDDDGAEPADDALAPGAGRAEATPAPDVEEVSG